MYTQAEKRPESPRTKNTLSHKHMYMCVCVCVCTHKPRKRPSHPEQRTLYFTNTCIHTYTHTHTHTHTHTYIYIYICTHTSREKARVVRNKRRPVYCLELFLPPFQNALAHSSSQGHLRTYILILTIATSALRRRLTASAASYWRVLCITAAVCE